MARVVRRIWRWLHRRTMVACNPVRKCQQHARYHEHNVDHHEPCDIAVRNGAERHELLQQMYRRDCDNRRQKFQFERGEVNRSHHSGQSVWRLWSILETKFSYPEKITIIIREPVKTKSISDSTPKMTWASVNENAPSARWPSSARNLISRMTREKARPKIKRREQPAAGEKYPLAYQFQLFEDGRALHWSYHDRVTQPKLVQASLRVQGFRGFTAIGPINRADLARATYAGPCHGFARPPASRRSDAGR